MYSQPSIHQCIPLALRAMQEQTSPTQRPKQPLPITKAAASLGSQPKSKAKSGTNQAPWVAKYPLGLQRCRQRHQKPPCRSQPQQSRQRHQKPPCQSQPQQSRQRHQKPPCQNQPQHLVIPNGSHHRGRAGPDSQASQTNGG